jgi:hypothetical protein
MRSITGLRCSLRAGIVITQSSGLYYAAGACGEVSFAVWTPVAGTSVANVYIPLLRDPNSFPVQLNHHSIQDRWQWVWLHGS